MTDLTPEEERIMIERAKAGDPAANYKMSLWALDQALAEPEEERWNRLAAKCLVRAADAGYPPARERMEALLQNQAPGADSAFRREVARAGTAAASGRRGRAVSRGEEPPAPAPAETRRAARKGGAGLFNFSQWDDAKWKKMQIVCIVICVVLALLIAVMLISGRKDAPSVQEEASAAPVPTVEAAATPVPTLYPDSATRQEIASADLEVFPADGDYVQTPTAAAVRTNGSDLRLRRGPGADYEAITSMENGAAVEVFAYQNGWALARYDRAGEAVWGWCSGDYLQTAETAETP